MEDLLSLLVFVIFIGGSILNSIAQAKKKRKEELEQALGKPPEEGLEETSTFDQGSAPPSPKPKPVSQTQGWEELRRQLERMLGQPGSLGTEVEESEPLPPPPSTRRDSSQKPAPVASESWREGQSPVLAEKKAAVLEKLPSPKKRREKTPQRIERDQPTQPTRRPAPAPSFLPAAPTSGRLQPVSASERKVPRRPPRNPFDFHPNPVTNAIIVSEILGPRRRNPLSLPRPTSPSR